MRFPAIFALLYALLAFSAHAHGVNAVIVDAGSAMAVEISYSTGEPMAYATISVFSPSSPKTEIIAGFADRNGRYAFLPDEDGEWRIEASDGMGHKAIAAANFTAGTTDIRTERGEKSPLYMRALLGISLIINIFAIYGFFALRRRYAHK